MSEFFQQFTDDQMALMLCGFAILGCWCVLQISYFVGKSTGAVAQPVSVKGKLRRKAEVQEKAA